MIPLGIIWKRIKDVKAGEVLGEDIYDSRSFVLLMKKNTKLTQGDIKQLADREINWIPIYVEDDAESLSDEYYEVFEVETSTKKKSFSEELPTVLPEKMYDEYIEVISNFVEDLRIGNRIDVSKVTNTCIGIVDYLEKQKDVILNFFSSHNLGFLRKHLINTSVLSVIIGDALNLQRHRMISVAKVALLHDIGWAFIEDNFQDIEPEGMAVPEEIFKKHVLVAVEVIRKNGENFLTPEEMNGILQHHERFDGKGIFGRKGKSVNWISRIVQIADAYDSLTSQITSKEAINPYQAAYWIINRSGIFYDPEFVNAFFKVFGVYPPGTKVELSDGRRGIVVKVLPNAPLRPVVKIGNFELDLSKSSQLWIRGVVFE